MITILYNPLSSNGKNVLLAAKLEKKYLKEKKEVNTKNLLDILNVREFLETYTSEDSIIILGGDGTLHRIVNAIDGLDIKPNVYLYKAGTGNDFIRSVKVKKNLADIKTYLTNLPTIIINEKKYKVLNGAGVGLDGEVIYLVDKSKKERNTSNYYRNTVKSFIKYQPLKATITVDGKEFREEKLWLATAMFSQYFGGGMKLAPTKTRDQKEIELVLLKDIPRFLLVLIFPTIYLGGLHRIFKKYVKFYRGTDITVKLDSDAFFQVDGESHYPVQGYRIYMEK